MKKLISLLLVLAMVCAVAAGCANNNTNETTVGTEETTTVADETTAAADETTAAADETTAAADETTAAAVATNGAKEVMDKIWALYGDDEKFFSIGGDMMNPVDNAPGVYSLEDAEALTWQLLIPAEQIANVDEAASLIHAMNTNTFTGSVFHLTEGADVDAFTAAMQAAVQGNQWMCGFPEKLIVAVIDGEYVLTVFGLGDAVNPFEAKLTEAYPEAVIAYNEAIAG